MVPIVTGIFQWSCISQTANPMVTEEDHTRIGKYYTYFDDHVIRKGQRLDLLNVRNDVKRAKIIKKIINSQTSLDRHGYTVLFSDPRFDNNQEVPFPTSAASRPILVHDVNYRTTFLS